MMKKSTSILVISANTAKKHAVIYALLCLLILPVLDNSNLYATTTQSIPLLSGIVFDAESGLPVPDAHIFIENTGIMTTSNNVGKFCCDPLNTNNFVIKVTHVAYQDYTADIRLKEGISKHLTINLQPSVTLSEANITFNRNTKYSKSNLILDYEELRSLDMDDVGEALNTLPGIQVNSSGIISSKTVKIRGSRSDHVLVYYDDVLLNDGSGSAVNLTAFSLDNIDRIEVKADGHAIGGAIYIYSRNSFLVNFGQSSGKVSSEYGKSGTKSAQGYFDLPYLRNVLTSSINIEQSNGNYEYKSETGTNENRINNSGLRESGFFKFSSHFGEKYSSSISYLFEKSAYGNPAPLWQAPTPSAESSNFFHLLNTALEKETINTKYRLGLSFQNRKHSNDSPATQWNNEIGQWVSFVPVSFDEDSRSAQVQFSIDHSINDLDLHSESVLSNLNYESSSTRTILQRRIWQRFQISYNANLDFLMIKPVIEGKYDNYLTEVDDYSIEDKNLAKFSWNASLPIFPVNQNNIFSYNIFFAGGYSFNPPSFISAFYENNTFVLGNPDLLPEEAKEFSMGFNNGFDLDSFTLFSRIVYFNKSIEEMIIWRRNYRNQYYPANLGKATIQGVELSADINMFDNKLELGGVYNYQKAINNDETSPFYNNKVPFQPDYYGSAYICFEIIGLKIRPDMYFSGRRYTTEDNLDPHTNAGGGLEKYVIYNMTISRNFKINKMDLKLSLHGENINSAEYELIYRMPMPKNHYSIKASLKW